MDGSILFDGATIENIIENAQALLTAPSLEVLFKALIYYYENDAFIVFPKK
ncbi:DUF7716 domain-containing protein [Commensalibacter communis]|uniref:DUF7716 domain-containing protein n=1 Tax=Commensalibacter communis TaxID=2972786 RepID=UPI0022FFC1DA|nr:hypothetical protein [Commensalibacter communis]CAI3926149.1 unnamed protein product [Commensalibacter communis]CAI3928532.1 unnamed protein product [Commensalibacter communis]